jgi:hypothetical protein
MSAPEGRSDGLLGVDQNLCVHALANGLQPSAGFKLYVTHSLAAKLS